MTSTPVTKLQTIVTNVTKPSASAGRMETLGASFSQIMDKAGTGTENAGTLSTTERKTVQGRKNTAVVEGTDKKTDTMNTTDNAQKSTDKAQAVPKEQPAENTAEGMEEAAKAADNVVKEAARELGISEEDVLKAMEALGMTWMDILNPGNMAKLVLQLSGETDMMNLLTDEGLYHTVQNLVETVNTEVAALQEALSMNDEEFMQFMTKLNEFVDAEQTVQQPDMTETLPTEPIVEIIREAEPAAVTEKEPLPKQEAAEDISLQNKTEVKQPIEAATEKQPAKQHETEGDNAQSKQPTFLQQMTNANAVQNAAADEPTAVPFASQETKQIMNQIMDYMKINVTPDISEMELQLHPESLGNVRIQLAAKEGVLTAHFKAESELVKTAIETQMVQLRENLNEKGIKVEAIEVTVESHAFERNLEQGNSDSSSFSEEPKKKSARRINLSSINGAEELPIEEMEDADRIAAEMMADAGNTVDFTA